MEFKAARKYVSPDVFESILIETQWNLKCCLPPKMVQYICMILIETQWNLKSEYPFDCFCMVHILIETQWNLKVYRIVGKGTCVLYINRNTVEFKDKTVM